MTFVVGYISMILQQTKQAFIWEIILNGIENMDMQAQKFRKIYSKIIIVIINE